MEWEFVRMNGVGIKNDTDIVFTVFIFNILVLEKEKKHRCLFLSVFHMVLNKIDDFLKFLHVFSFIRILNDYQFKNMWQQKIFNENKHWSNCNKTIYTQEQIFGILEVKGHKNKGRDDIDNVYSLLVFMIFYFQKHGPRTTYVMFNLFDDNSFQFVKKKQLTIKFNGWLSTSHSSTNKCQNS